MPATRRNFLKTALALGVLSPFARAQPEQVTDQSAGEELWYSQPAERWLEALPVGNGRLGGMVYGGIPVERCALVDDGRACAFEYNVVQWGKTELPPQAGLAAYVRGQSGKLAEVRIYDDVDPPVGPSG